MAKVSMIQREKRRSNLSDRFKDKRAQLKSVIANSETPFEEKMEAVTKLQKMPRDSSPVRKHNRCRVTGRPKGYYRKFGLCRNKLREAAMRGDIPGLVKASW